MLEKDIENRFVRYARKRGCRAVKFADPASPGGPDRLVLCPKGKSFFVEFKRPGEQPRANQLAYHRMLEKLGHDVFVSDDFEHAKGLLDDFLTTFVST